MSAPPVDAGLVILVPVLGRPHRVDPLLASIDAATPNARTLFIADPGDKAEIRALEAAGAEWTSCAGNYATKINHGVGATSQPWIFTGADDLDFRPGWLEACFAAIAGAQSRPPGVGVVGTNDLCNARTATGEHSTHSLVARWYVGVGTIDEGGKLLHEGYPHEFVDDEFVETAKARGAYVHATDAIVEHLHPMCGKAPSDELYAAQAWRMRLGRRIYRKRRALWAT